MIAETLSSTCKYMLSLCLELKFLLCLENEEEDAIIRRSKIATVMAIRHLIIFRYMATMSHLATSTSAERQKGRIRERYN